MGDGARLDKERGERFNDLYIQFIYGYAQWLVYSCFDLGDFRRANVLLIFWTLGKQTHFQVVIEFQQGGQYG